MNWIKALTSKSI